MTKRIRFYLPGFGVQAIATLLEDRAPATCRMVWELLEKVMEAPVHHGTETGPELWFFIPNRPDLPYEHCTVFPAPGDVVVYHRLPGIVASNEEVSDIGIYYDRGGKNLIASLGWIPCNVFATVTENLAALACAARDVPPSGKERIIVSRAME